MVLMVADESRGGFKGPALKLTISGSQKSPAVAVPCREIGRLAIGTPCCTSGVDEATRQIKRHLPQTRIIALSMHDEVQVTDRMRSAGATAYLLKTAPSEELLAAIRGPKADGGP